MKRRFLLQILVAAVVSLAAPQLRGQEQADLSLTRPRRVSPQPQKPENSTEQTRGGEQVEEKVKAVIPREAREPLKPASVSRPVEVETNNAPIEQSATALHPLSPPWIRSRIGEAERLLKSRPLQTAMTSPSIEFVTLAALDRASSRIHLITLPKETFLTRGAEVTLPSSLGANLSVGVLRANGVNTAVNIFDSTGRALIPLTVEFPIEKRGVFREMAYYTSAHPALRSPELARAGQLYVRTMIDLAAKRLRDKGVFVSPQIVDVAERLCLVEHVDHDRFRLEDRLALFDEVYSLYALNELDTYRYSVSTAGAGGMVQMIPWAYNLVRQRYPGVGLNPDFVVGMRNHANALQAMLLYMQDTWNDLIANEDVQYALSAKVATPAELLAAGYNSNAARLPLYIRRGDSGWRTLIPRETQIYLQIYKSLEALVPIKPRTNTVAQTLD